MNYHENEKRAAFTSPERRESAEKDVQDDTSAPHVYLWPIASLENLWSHVTPAANHFGEPIPCTAELSMSLIPAEVMYGSVKQACDGDVVAIRTRLEVHGEAEVDGLERRLLRLVYEQEVLRLQVPVHHSVLVAQLRIGFVHDRAGTATA